VHVHSRSSRQLHSPAGGVRPGTRARSRRGAQPCAPSAAGHVVGRVVRRNAAGGGVPVRRSTRRRVTVLHRTGVRSDVALATPSRLIRLVMAYQRATEGRPSPCRFTPSCSQYAIDAFEQHGTSRGMWLTVRRLLRCRPFGPSGWDPVPPAHRSARAIGSDRATSFVGRLHRHPHWRDSGFPA